MSFKTMTTWETKPPEYPGWYNTLIINNSGTPEVMTMRWNKETGWDNKSWEVRGWCTFPLICEFMDIPKVIPEDIPEGVPEVIPKDPENVPETPPEVNILWLTNNLIETFSNHTSDGVIACNMTKQIILEYIRNGGTHADK